MNLHIRSSDTYIYGVLVAILIVAAFFRYTAINETHGNKRILSDSAEYMAYAYNLRNHGIYSNDFYSDAPVPDAKRSPGYPIFLLPFSRTLPTASSLLSIKTAQAILGCLTVLMTFFLSRRYMSPGYSLLVAFLTANSPHLISAETYILTESLFTFLCILFLWFCTKLTGIGQIKYLALIGFLLGLAVLTRPSLQYFLVAFFLFCSISFGCRRGTRITATIALFLMVIYSPWAIRNLQTIGKPSDSTLSIAFLHHGMYPDFTYQDNRNSYGFPYRFDPASDEIANSTGSVLMEIKRRFTTEPGRHLLWYLYGKPKAFWSWDIVNGVGDVFVYPIEKSPYFTNAVFKAQHYIMWYLHWPLVVICHLTILMVLLPKSFLKLTEESLFAVRLISIFVLYFIGIHIIGAPFPRYSIPLRPLMYGLGVFGLCYLIGRIVPTGQQILLQNPRSNINDNASKT